MKNSIRAIIIVLVSIVFLGGCSTQVYHDYIMSGQVVAVDGKEVVVCVSDTDGLKQHDVFKVYRTVYEYDAISEGETGYTREFVGRIRLGKKKDNHFAEAIVLSGDVINNDMVEFYKE
jgi:hypothetical protein|tara:strand:+ start:1138 stop:1491 length:354 start_codon:yes stop_codon:yes gene_type:complete